MKIKAAHETEAFINELGYYAIKQQSQFLDDRGNNFDAVVQLTPDQMRLLIDDMELCLESADDWFDSVEPEPDSKV